MALTVSQVNYKDNSSWRSLIDMIYPKGSIFLGYNLMNKNDTTSANHPGKLFGGNWLPIENKMLRSGWGGATGGADSHRHYVSALDGDDKRGGYCVAMIGASNWQVSSLGYQAYDPPANMTNPDADNAWDVATEYRNKTLYNAFLPKTDTPAEASININRYTMIGTSYTEEQRFLNHGVRVYGWTALSEHIPAYQTVNTWYRTS